MSANFGPTLQEARARLDYIINISRVDMYKPVHIAEVLYYSRTNPAGLDVADLNTYRNPSLRWRNLITRRLLNKISTSSARYQHDIWNETAMPPRFLAVLDLENKATKGAVEKYIYLKFTEKQNMVSDIILLLEQANPENFKLADLFEYFETNQAVRRSIDKVYEIVVYSLFETVVVALEAQVTVSVPTINTALLQEFSDLASTLLGLSVGQSSHTLPAHVYRVGVTNAADRGLDMWANFGPAIQVKHLSLNPNLAESIVEQVESDNVVIVCRDNDQQVIQTIIRQIGWGRRVRGIITENQLIAWYALCLRGNFAPLLAATLLTRLAEEFKKEFPQSLELAQFFQERAYDTLEIPLFWQ